MAKEVPFIQGEVRISQNILMVALTPSRQIMTCAPTSALSPDFETTPHAVENKAGELKSEFPIEGRFANANDAANEVFQGNFFSSCGSFLQADLECFKR